MSERYKQILEDWYWDEKKNLLVHECDQEYSWNTQRLDSEIRCMYCKEEAPQAVVDICLLCNIKTMYVFKIIEGRWGVEKYYLNSKPYLAHQCRGKTWPSTCKSSHCGGCETEIPKHIIKYCKENNVEIGI